MFMTCNYWALAGLLVPSTSSSTSWTLRTTSRRRVSLVAVAHQPLQHDELSTSGSKPLLNTRVALFGHRSAVFAYDDVLEGEDTHVCHPVQGDEWDTNVGPAEPWRVQHLPV